MAQSGQNSAAMDKNKVQGLARVARERLKRRDTLPSRKRTLPLSLFPALNGPKNNDVVPSSGMFTKLRFEKEPDEISDLHPVVLGKLLQQYFPGSSDVRKTKKAVFLKTRDAKQFFTAQAVFEKGVTVTLKNTESRIILEEIRDRNVSCGVLSDPSFKEMTDVEMLEELKASGNKVREAKQFMKKKGENVSPTGAFLITFFAEKIPERVLLCGISYRIRQYYPNVLICSKCACIGHVRAKCKSEVEICRSCGAERGEGHECGSRSCVHCPDGADHGPSDPNCPVLEYEKMVIQYKVDYRVTYRVARETISNLLNDNSQHDTPIATSSYASQVSQPVSYLSLSNVDEECLELQRIRGEREKKEKELAAIRRERQRIEALNREIEQELAALKRARLENVALSSILEQTQMEVDEEIAAANQKRKADDDSSSDELSLPPSKKNENELKTKLPTDPEDRAGPMKISTGLSPSKKARPVSRSSFIESLNDEQKQQLDDVENAASKRQMNVTWYREGNQLIPVELPALSIDL